MLEVFNRDRREKNLRNKNILIIGGLKKAKAIAKVLLNKGFKVTVINKIKADCELIAEMEGVNVIHGDGTRPFVLDDADASEMGMVIAMTKRDEDNLIACQLCKKKYGVDRTVCILADPNKIDFFHRLGVDSVICELEFITQLLEQQIESDDIAKGIPLDNFDVSILEIKIPLEAPAAGKTLEEIDLQGRAVVSCVTRNGSSFLPQGNTLIRSGDRLLVVVYENDSIEVTKILAGE